MNLTDFKLQNGILTPSPSFGMVDPNYTEPAEVLEAVERCNKWLKESTLTGLSNPVSPVVALTWFLQNNSIITIIGDGKISKDDANNRVFRDAIHNFLSTGTIFRHKGSVNALLDQSGKHSYLLDGGIMSLNKPDLYNQYRSKIDPS